MRPAALPRESDAPVTPSAAPVQRHRSGSLTTERTPIAPAIAPRPLASGTSTASSRGVVLFTASTVALVGYLAWICGDALGQWHAASRVPIVTQSLLVLLSAFAAVLAVGASSRRDIDRATQRAWLFFAVAQVATGIVSASWVYRLSYGSSLAGPLTFQIIAAAYDVLLLCALVTFPVRRLQSADRATFWLDSAIVAGVAAVLTWHLLLRTALVAAGSDWHTSMYALAYPVGDVVLLFATVVLLLRRPLPGSVRAIRILFLSILLNTTADVLYMWAYIAKEAQGTRFFYIAWAVVAWMAAAAAFSQGQKALFSLFSTDTAVRGRRGRPPSLIPYVAIVSIYATLLVEVYRTETHTVVAALQFGVNGSLLTQFPVTALVVGAIVVTAIVIARQVAAQRKNSELAAERLAREAHFRALVQHSSDMVLVLDASGIVREASPAVVRVLGHAAEQVVGQSFCDFFIADDIPVVQADIAQAVAATDGDATATGPCEWRLRDVAGHERWVEAICTNLLNDPVVAGVVINGRDVSERKQLEAELTHRAYHDPLTGLVNRSRFRTKVVGAIGRAPFGMRPGDGRTGFAILYIDLDGFKAVNDVFGHDAGDVVLSTIADRLRDATRGSDTAARLGGDEFAILLERLRDADEVRMVAERVLHLVRQPVRIDHREAVVGASIGIVCAALGGTAADEAIALDPDVLLRNADSAMYAAKARGRGNYEFFSPVSDGVA